MDERQQKGLAIAATARIRYLGNAYWVPSQSAKAQYAVRLHDDGPHCNCPDFELRGKRCKHSWAVEFFLKRETVTEDNGTTTVSETAAVRVTYSQPWAQYNAAATSEKESFCKLFRALCATVPNPPQRMGRKRLPLSDMLFAAGFKIYSTFSGRRFSTDLRKAQTEGLIEKAPHYNSVFRVIESEAVTPILHSLIELSSLPLREVEQDFAVDSTGFGTARFYRYYSEKYGHEQLGRAWVKTHAMVGVKTNIVTAVKISGMNEHDSPQFPALVEQTAKNFTMREISADKAYSSRGNLELVESRGAVPFIPFRANARPVASPGTRPSETWTRLYHYFALNRDEFLAHYHKRSNVETTFSMIKRVFGDSVRSKTTVAQANEVLLKIACHNVRVLVHQMYELQINPIWFSRSAGTPPAPD